MARRRHRRRRSSKIRKFVSFLATFLILTVAGLATYSTFRDSPQDLPWTSLKLNDPIGFFTGRKLAELTGEYAKCQQMLDEVGVNYQLFPATGSGECRRDQNISIVPGNGAQISYSPSRLAPSCPVVAALKVWEDQVVQPAALKHFGQKVSNVRHLGSFSCRPIAGTDNWSEHATANAIDIAGFVLADGQQITLIGDWTGNDKEARFLREVRDGSCDLFSTVLSPDYNAAHADHFHFDQATRGAMGYRLCR